ncbi:MAG: vanadium-dependent haloperoxidase [Bacteroidota bacterium]
MRIFSLLLMGLVLLGLGACEESGGDQTEASVTTDLPEEINPNYQEEALDAQLVHASMQQLTDVIVHDIFSPPVASRIYAYPSIAAYQALRPAHPNYRSLDGQLNGLQNCPQPEPNQEYCFPLASLHAFLQTGKTLIFSEAKMEMYQSQLKTHFDSLKMPRAVYERSIAYGDAMSQHILAWADKDMYKETRTFPKYSIPIEPEKWKPTPPDYMDGIEPHWREIRPFVLDSAEQFVPLPPTPFDIKKGSKFYKETMEVYKALDKDREERLAIASFWDCNPYVSHHKGHVMYATKKITPGGHWMGIAKIAAQNSDADMMKTVETYTLTAISLADAFISCWDEKYRSVLIRPETVINEYFDEDWMPALQTPPFPEHTSGHSVISTAASVALTNLYGDDFAFIDSTEIAYGLPARSYDSFYDAAEEAAISRLYGGIHYRPAIDYGVEQGRKVGKWIVGRLKTEEEKVGMK